jgi:hypothetical protein
VSNKTPVNSNKKKQRLLRGRNIGLFLVLLAFVALLYGVTIVKIKMGYGP